MQHLTDDDLALYYYGEANCEAHVGACASCRERYQELQRVLNSLDSAPVPERAPEYGGAVWKKIAPQLGILRRPWWQSRPVWAIACAAALLAFFAGSLVERWRHPAVVTVVQGPIRERVLLVAMDAHLESTQRVLAELVNASTDARAGMDITWEQQSAEDLLQANRLYRQTAAGSGEQNAENLLRNVEEVLLEVAHSPTRLNAAQLSDLRKRIEDKGLIFEIRVFSSRVKDRPMDDALRGAKGIL
jgi:hypothetical protein